jgi:pimeloyl-ACP methyl ester carboxylesterase
MNHPLGRTLRGLLAGAQLILACLAGMQTVFAAHRIDVHTSVVPSGDASIVLRTLGRGPAIVMVPSAGRSTHDFDPLARRLAEAGWWVVLPEPRGVAGSTGLRSDLTLDDYGHDILAVMDALKIKHAVILAHAAGARDARIAIALAPKRFSSLISLATGAGGDASVKADITPERAREAHEQASDPSRFSEAQRLSALQLLYFAPTSDASVWLDGWWPKASTAHAAAAQRTPRQAWWPGHPVASLIIEGQDDAIAPMQGEKLQSVLGSDAVILCLPHAGHAMLPEQSNAIKAVVLAYLGGQKVGLQSVIDSHVGEGRGGL